MNINELKKDEIYLFKYSTLHYINKIKNVADRQCYSIEITRNFNYNQYDSYGQIRSTDITEATPEQKHWLETCIKEDKFISYDEAMKSFVKEFVLPEKWCVKGTICKTVQKYFLTYKDNKLDDLVIHPSYETWYFHSNPVVHEMYVSSYKHDDYTAITFDQFKQYVLKETVEEITLPYKILKQDNNIILQVENNEGSVFDIGDYVKSLNSYQKGKITGFRYSINNWNPKVDKSIIALTDFQKNGISINKIEHYIEPKVKHVVITNSHVDQLKLHNQSLDAVVIPPEESLLDKAKRLYPIGTEFKSILDNNVICKVTKDNHHYFLGESTIFISTDKGDRELYESPNKWAEIISKPEVDNSKYEILSLIGGYGNKPLILNDKPNINSWIDGYNLNYKIHSVKQLSTGNIFTVGDEVKLSVYNTYGAYNDGFRTIKSIELINNKIVFSLIYNKSIPAGTVLLQNVTKI